MDSEVHMFQHFVAASVQLIGATRNVVSVRLNASHSFLYSPHSHRIAMRVCVQMRQVFSSSSLNLSQPQAD